MAIALMYHDVVERGLEDASGFPGGDSARYKLTPAQFDDHLRAIAASRVSGRLPGNNPMLTFDDGGVSAKTAAEKLEAYGWRGHFFVTTGYIGHAGFLTAASVRELRAGGHVVGSHSCSHPLLMARWPYPKILDEWRRSVRTLEDLLGEQITIGSVPGGHYSRAVADAAREAGLTVLFTSRPTGRISRRHGLAVMGRYAIRRSTSAASAAAVAAGARAPRLRQLALWDARRVLKATGGRAYVRVRAALLGRSEHVVWGDEHNTGPTVMTGSN